FALRPGDFDDMDRGQKVYYAAVEELGKYDDTLAPTNWKSVEVPDVLKNAEGMVDRSSVAWVLHNAEKVADSDGFHYFSADAVRVGDPEIDAAIDVMIRNANRIYAGKVS